MAAILSAVLVLALVGVDQWTKYWALHALTSGRTVTVLPHVLQFRYLENTGMAFSMFSNRTWALSGLTMVILVVLIVLLCRGTFSTRGMRIGALLILSGGFGNLIDRVSRHYVVDFIEFTFTNFAVFNFADCCVTIGAVILVIAIFVDFAHPSEKRTQER